MVKLVFVCYRRPDLTHEQFCTHWREVHAPLIHGMHEQIGLRKYIQNHPLSAEVNAAYAASRGMTLEDLPDGVAEAWWDSPEEMDATFATEAGQELAALMLEDEAKFVDYSRSRALFVEEHPIVEGPA
jgi:uncharacterized protein (TIGR02118 family)